MSRRPPIGVLSQLSTEALGVFRGQTAVELGVTRNQLAALADAGALERVLPDVYRMTVVPPTNAQSLKAALL